MTRRGPVLFGALFLAALLVLSVFSGFVSPAAVAEDAGVTTGTGTPPAPGSEFGHYGLGDGRYVAIIPAAPGTNDSTNLTPARDTYIDQALPGSPYCGESHLDVKSG
jgi:hypothetical protein